MLIVVWVVGDRSAKVNPRATKPSQTNKLILTARFYSILLKLRTQSPSLTASSPLYHTARHNYDMSSLRVQANRAEPISQNRRRMTSAEFSKLVGLASAGAGESTSSCCDGAVAKWRTSPLTSWFAAVAAAEAVTVALVGEEEQVVEGVDEDVEEPEVQVERVT